VLLSQLTLDVLQSGFQEVRGQVGDRAALQVRAFQQLFVEAVIDRDRNALRLAKQDGHDREAMDAIGCKVLSPATHRGLIAILLSRTIRRLNSYGSKGFICPPLLMEAVSIAHRPLSNAWAWV
jgi:hypothetical protein